MRSLNQYVLSLYRQMLRKGRQLLLTDKQYYYNRVRAEFEKNKNLQNETDIKFQVEKAESFLKNDRLV